MRRARRAYAAGSLAAFAACSIATRAASADPEPKPPSYALATKLEGGAFAREIFGLPVYGPDFGFALGRTRADATPASGGAEPFFMARYAFGRTPEGLATHTVRMGADVDVVFGRARLNLGGGLMWLGIDRTSDSGLVQHWGLDLGVGASVDLVRLSTTSASAITLGARFDADVFPHKLFPRTFSPVGTIDAGIRF